MAYTTNHVFTPNPANWIMCNICKKDKASHWHEGTCEHCGKPENVTLVYGNMLLCGECHAKELASYSANNTVAKQQERVDAMNAALREARKVNESIGVRTDIFNAKTVAIVDLEKIINADDSITNKPNALATELTTQFKNYQTVIFELNEKVATASTEQKAIQIYLNQLANKLTAEEREKLKIKDINYQPTLVKPPSKPRAIKTTGKTRKLDMVLLNKVATELGVSTFTLQSFVIQKNITIEVAGVVLARNIAAAKASVTTNDTIVGAEGTMESK